MIVLVVSFSVRPEDLERTLELSRRLVEYSRREPGCLAYIAHQQSDDPLRFCFYEAYADEAAIEAHRSSAHYAECVTNGLFPLIENVERHSYRPLAGLR